MLFCALLFILFLFIFLMSKQRTFTRIIFFLLCFCFAVLDSFYCFIYVICNRFMSTLATVYRLLIEAMSFNYQCMMTISTERSSNYTNGNATLIFAVRDWNYYTISTRSYERVWCLVHIPLFTDRCYMPELQLVF